MCRRYKAWELTHCWWISKAVLKQKKCKTIFWMEYVHNLGPRSFTCKHMSYINSCTCVFIKIFITTIKWITNKDLLNSTGNSVLCNNLNGKRIWTRLDTCIWITESLCCMVVVYSLSRVQILATPWTVACQTSLSVGFPRQEYWSGLPFPSPGDLPHPGDWTRVSCIARGLLPAWWADSVLLRHQREANTTLLINYAPIQNKKLKNVIKMYMKK